MGVDRLSSLVRCGCGTVLWRRRERRIDWVYDVEVCCLFAGICKCGLFCKGLTKGVDSGGGILIGGGGGYRDFFPL